ncbi:hypothetical protein PN462_10285 [Spirulina sp. CS-785/01]|nr:hypothetical protein [Spirulina sp. CS-785/01]MDB9313486.1 hypothetical protein [Spirulina sp. CS-785/01]
MLLNVILCIELFRAQNGWQHEIIQDLGSGMNYSKRGLKRLYWAVIDRSGTKAAYNYGVS